MSERTAARAVRWWRDAGAAAGAVGAALLAMIGVAAAGLALAGAGAAGSVRSLTAAVVVLASGGPVHVSLDAPGGAAIPVSVTGVVHVLPLGVTGVGVLAFGLALLLPLRRRPLPARRLAIRLAAAVALFPALLGLVSLAGHGRLALSINPAAAGAGAGGLPGGFPGGLPGNGLPGGFPGGLPGLPGGLPGGFPGAGGFPGLPGAVPGLPTGASGPTGLNFQAGHWSAVLAGLGWVLAALLLCWLVARRLLLPAGAAARRRAGGRAAGAAWAVRTVLAAAVALAAVGGLIAAVAAPSPGKALGGVLLAAPNVVFVAITRALGVPWHSSVSGAIGANLRDRPDALPGTGAIAGLPSPHAPGWVLPVLGAVLLLACGLLTAARTPTGPAAPGWSGRLRAAAVPAAWLALVLGATLPVLTALAGFAVSATASVFGRGVPVADLGFAGNALVAAPLGLSLGAAAGFAGALLLAAVRDRRGRAGNVPAAPAVAAGRPVVMAGGESGYLS